MLLNKLKTLFLLLATALLLQGCLATTLVGGAAVATKMATDPRTVGTQIDDETLEEKINFTLQKDPQIKSEVRVNIISYSGRVLLVGQAPNANLAQLAKSLAEGVEGVTGEVYNEIRIMPKISFGQITKDGLITTEIKSRMLLDANVKSTKIKVFTENAEVFLMGNVTPSQAEAAIQVARHVSGVKKVTTVFKYIQ